MDELKAEIIQYPQYIAVGAQSTSCQQIQIVIVQTAQGPPPEGRGE